MSVIVFFIVLSHDRHIRFFLLSNKHQIRLSMNYEL